MILNLDFKVTVFRPIDALSVLCAQLTRDLFAVAKFLFTFLNTGRYEFLKIYCHSLGGNAAATLSDTAYL